jgi:UDP-2,3-diacylglucosamine pyrophosphatase LpxH
MNKYKTIIVSDIHLGMEDSKVNEVIKFLTDNKTETLILNGDIIDTWYLKRRFPLVLFAIGMLAIIFSVLYFYPY